jgi:hypothetical protein
MHYKCPAALDLIMKSNDSVVLKNPSELEVTNLLAQAGSAGLRGVEDYNGNVFLWPYNDGTHMMMAGLLCVPYDSATDYVDKLTGKTFYIRCLDDWLTRERRRAEPDSFSSKCRHGTRPE